jgi:hypothetical protein
MVSLSDRIRPVVGTKSGGRRHSLARFYQGYHRAGTAQNTNVHLEPNIPELHRTTQAPCYVQLVQVQIVGVN